MSKTDTFNLHMAYDMDKHDETRGQSGFEKYKILLVLLEHHKDLPWGMDTPIKTELLLEHARSEIHGDNK